MRERIDAGSATPRSSIRIEPVVFARWVRSLWKLIARPVKMQYILGRPGLFACCCRAVRYPAD
jgi:hypothetical protein